VGGSKRSCDTARECQALPLALPLPPSASLRGRHARAHARAACTVTLRGGARPAPSRSPSQPHASLRGRHACAPAGAAW
jgi:hypothetical protein